MNNAKAARLAKARAELYATNQRIHRLKELYENSVKSLSMNDYTEGLVCNKERFASITKRIASCRREFLTLEKRLDRLRNVLGLPHRRHDFTGGYLA